MIAQPYHSYIERTDSLKHMARFYAMAIEPTLFGEVQLTRRWGRIGARGQTMTHSFPREDEAVALFLALLRVKRRRGYRPKVSSPARQTRSAGGVIDKREDSLEGRDRVWGQVDG